MFLNIGAKSEYKLDLESAIDCYLNCETPEYENLKNRFYRISQNSDNDDVKTTALYYLSEILLLQNNIHEAYKFIDQADNINTADTIDRNILYGQIFIQPTRTAEFIILDFTIQPSGATFPE